MNDMSGPDRSWHGLYRIGRVCALLYVLLGVVVPTIQVMTAQYDWTLVHDDFPDLGSACAVHDGCRGGPPDGHTRRSVMTI
jgi:hypothetical protein